MDYTVFDVETANNSRASICSIGIIRYEQGNIVYEKELLINPETEFGYVQINVHGITQNTVKNAPSFPTVWKEIEPYFTNTVLVAHNAKSMDLCALYRTLERYNLPKVYNKYLCTLELSRLIFRDDPNIQRYGLSDICNYLNIPLERHHNSLDDAKACFNILNYFMDHFPLMVIPSVYHHATSCCSMTSNVDKAYIEKNTFERSMYSTETLAMRNLQSLIINTVKDGKITFEETQKLKNWVEAHGFLKGFYPFDKIFDTVERIMEDGVVTSEETEELRKLLDAFINPQTANITGLELTGKTVCLTGDFEYGSRKAVEEYLTSMGAVMTKSVSAKLDILIMGNQGSAAWKYGNYGSKYEKARQLIAKGKNIIIVKENVIF